jgi:hypothetical protein
LKGRVCRKCEREASQDYTESRFCRGSRRVTHTGARKRERVTRGSPMRTKKVIILNEEVGAMELRSRKLRVRTRNWESVKRICSSNATKPRVLNTTRHCLNPNPNVAERTSLADRLVLNPTRSGATRSVLACGRRNHERSRNSTAEPRSEGPPVLLDRGSIQGVTSPIAPGD